VFELGSLRLRLVSDGEFRLDGGAMFGVVPKPLWEKAKPADERNRIRMAMNCLLIESGSDLVLIDTGAGDKHDAKFHDVYGISLERTTLPQSIRAAGFEPGDVTHVVLSHLHFDHCGWNTRRDGTGALVPTFPHARYWLERGEVEHARRPSERDRASYFPENWEPLFEAGVAELFDGEAEVITGVRPVKAPGHNADMCVVALDGGPDGVAEGDGSAAGESAAVGRARGIFWADLVPTVAHVPLPWIMGYDLYPLTTLESKKRWLPRAAAGGWLGFFEHEAETPWARVLEERPGKFAARPLANAASRIPVGHA
jgi:glyoxylase-like metal-dependent hydrolase (beta-lactamase superfamily II)